MQITTKDKQVEMETMPDRTPLGQACHEFLVIRGQMEDLQAQSDSKASEIMLKLQDEGRSHISVNGWEFSIKASALKLAVSKDKGFKP